MSQNVSIVGSIYKGAFQPISISNWDLYVTIDKCSFQSIYSSESGGCAIVATKFVECSRVCIFDSGSNMRGGIFYFDIVDQNIITGCSIESCNNKVGETIYQRDGDNKIECINFSNSIAGAACDDESSVYGAEYKFCQFSNISGEAYICCVEEIEVSGKRNSVHHLIFVKCRSSNSGAWCILTSYKNYSDFDTLVFIENYIPSSCLVGQYGSGDATLSNAYFNPNNICAKYVSSGVKETSRLPTSTNIVIEKMWDQCEELIIQNESNRDYIYKFKIFVSMAILTSLQLNSQPKNKKN